MKIVLKINLIEPFELKLKSLETPQPIIADTTAGNR